MPTYQLTGLISSNHNNALQFTLIRCKTSLRAFVLILHEEKRAFKGAWQHITAFWGLCPFLNLTIL